MTLLCRWHHWSKFQENENEVWTRSCFVPSRIYVAAVLACGCYSRCYSFFLLFLRMLSCSSCSSQCLLLITEELKRKAQSKQAKPDDKKRLGPIKRRLQMLQDHSVFLKRFLHLHVSAAESCALCIQCGWCSHFVVPHSCACAHNTRIWNSLVLLSSFSWIHSVFAVVSVAWSSASSYARTSSHCAHAVGQHAACRLDKPVTTGENCTVAKRRTAASKRSGCLFCCYCVCCLRQCNPERMSVTVSISAMSSHIALCLQTIIVWRMIASVLMLFNRWWTASAGQ